MAFALKGAGSASTDWSITANQSSFVLTTSVTAGAANDLAVLMYAVDNNATADGDEVAVTGVTDSAGNFWQKAVEFTNGQGTAQTGATNGIWYCNLQNALAVGATITLAFSNNTSRDAAAVSLTYFTKAAGFKAAVEGTPGTLANDAANAGSLSVTTANIACLRIRSIASETSVATAITKTAAFTAVLTQAISTGGAATGNQGVRGEYLISTGTGTASAPTGGGGTVDHASVYAAFREDAFTVGDPPHNSDQVAGAQVAIRRRAAAAALLITASAGLFLPPTPRVADPAAPATALGVPVLFGSAPRARLVYYQSNFPALYVAPVAAAVQPEGWQAPLSGAPPVARAAQNFGSVPATSFAVVTVDKWQQPLSIAPRVAQAQAGFSFVPYNTAQLSVNFTNFGWHGPTWTAVPVAKAVQGDSFAPYNTAQLSVNFTNFGWHGPTSTAALVAKAIQGDSFVPYNTAQVVVAAYTNFWLQPLSGAPAVAQARQGDAFVPFDTAQTTPAVSTAIAIPLDWGGGAAPQLRTVYYQSKVEPLYVAPVVVAAYTNFWLQPLSGAIPVAKAQQDFGSVPFYTAAPLAGIAGIAWFSPLGTVPTRTLAVQPGNSFVPYNTAQVVVAATGRRKPLLFISNVGRLMN